MLDPSAIAAGLSKLPPQQLRATLASYLPQGATSAEKIQAIENGLRSPLGQTIRDAMARWIVDEIVPVEKLVPKQYLNWRAPVRDSMMFVVARLSPQRLAPKLLEQIELPFDTPAELRLLRLIAKVPGLQKLGQVIARNQHLHPALRKALSRLENGIRDVRPEDIQFECHGVKVIVDPKSLPYLHGTELDYTREGLNEGFKFRNPNVKDECGCGESFNV